MVYAAHPYITGILDRERGPITLNQWSEMKDYSKRQPYLNNTVLKYTLTQVMCFEHGVFFFLLQTYNCNRSCLFINKGGTTPKFILH